MTYQPNLNDPRVIKRIERALGFSIACLRKNKEKEWSTRYLDVVFGRSNDELGRWLRSRLLTTVNSHYDMESGVCKTYMLNTAGYQKIKGMLYGEEIKLDENLEMRMSNEALLHDTEYSTTPSDTDLVVKWATETYHQELVDGSFGYMDKANRLWHPLQQVSRQHKPHVFTKYDYRNEYDIVACCPTVIHQLSQRCGMDYYLFTLRDYLNDRTTHRNRIAHELGITQKSAKRIINALFAGARITTNTTKWSSTSIYVECERDVARVMWLQQDPWINELRNDIATCWQHIVEATPTLRRKKRNGDYMGLTANEKMGIYFAVERQILNAVREWLDMTYTTYFLEHDGWNTRTPIDISETISWVKYRTGYSVRVSHETL